MYRFSYPYSPYGVKIAFALSLLSGAGAAFASNACTDVATLAEVPAYQTTTVNATDAVCLRSFSWQPAGSPPRGVVVITHGIRDHALRYDHFARQLVEQGYAVYAQDLRGHAHSGGDRQRFDSMEQLVADTDLVVEQARQQYPTLPVFLYGHSLGGLITTEYTLAHPEHLSGVVLSGAALERPQSVSGFSVFLARVVAAIAPGFKAVAVDDSEFSRDPAVMSKLQSDPLISHDKLPAISAVASINGMQDVRERMGQIKTPLLIMYGTADKVNPIEGSRTLAAGIGSADKTVKPYEGLYHDMLNEPEHNKVAADVVAWLNAHLKENK